MTTIIATKITNIILNWVETEGDIPLKGVMNEKRREYYQHKDSLAFLEKGLVQEG